jgi:tetratricopeptide (TPR) repeat protein
MGGHQRLQCWVENNVAILYHIQGRYPEAIAAYQRARGIAEASLRPDDPDVARPIGNLALALSQAGRPAEALAFNQRAVDILRKALGAGHPEVAMHMSNRGEILNALGRYEEARAIFNSALAIWNKEFPPDHPDVADSLNGIGASYLGQDEPEPALAPLERALAIREKSGAEPSQIGETRFLLARALWDSGRDRARAVTLAQAAKAAYGDKAPWRDKVEAIDRWLAQHPSPLAVPPHPRTLATRH